MDSMLDLCPLHGEGRHEGAPSPLVSKAVCSLHVSFPKAAIGESSAGQAPEKVPRGSLTRVQLAWPSSLPLCSTGLLTKHILMLT